VRRPIWAGVAWVMQQLRCSRRCSNCDFWLYSPGIQPETRFVVLGGWSDFDDFEP
jgi:hypothetical protein